MKWYKASNRLIDDTKLRLVSKRAKVKHIETVVTLHSLLERCSQNKSNCFGNLKTIVEELEVQLDLPSENIIAIIEVMTQLEIITANTLTKWEDHQVSDSYDRVKRWREKQKETVNETPCNVTDTQRRVDKRRLDSIEEKKPKRKIKYSTFESLVYRNFTEDEKNHFKKNNPNVDIEKLIITMGRWLAKKGKSYKDYYAALQDWADKEQNNPLSQSKIISSISEDRDIAANPSLLDNYYGAKHGK